MKTLNRIVRILVVAVMVFVGARTSFAATYFLDQNGTNFGFWDGVTLPIGADMTSTTNWTLSQFGTNVTTIISAANNIQIGASNSDFNGATIYITNNFNGNIGASPSSFNIVSTNAVVNFLATSVNERYNHATTIAVTNGSTMVMAGNPNNNYNWNAQQFTFVGNGTIVVSNALGNNDATSTGGGITMNMIGGTLKLAQTGIGTFGNGTNANSTGFTLTNGTVDFISPQSFSTVFASFTNGVVLGTVQTVKLMGGAMDNLSGGPGTIFLNTGAYILGASNFTYIGSSEPMSLGPNAVFLTNGVSPQVTVNANTLTIGGAITDFGNNLGLTKAGVGTLVLTGANTYSGPTVAAAGTLDVSTVAIGNSAYTVDDGATLEVSVANVGQSLEMSSLTIGTNEGATLQFDVGDIKNPTTAPINLGGGALSVNGAGQISFASIGPITNYPATIPLVRYGFASGNLAGLTLGSLPASTPPFQGYVSNDTVDSVLVLVLTNGLLTAPPGPPQTLTWVGQANSVNNGSWDLTTSNWSVAGLTTNYVNLTTNGLGDFVVFDDTLTGTSQVILTRALSPATITFNNNDSNYVFSGTGSITGASSMLVNSNGIVTLDNSGNNNFTGGVVMSNGVLQLGNNDTNGNPGTGPVFMTNNAALVFDRTDSALGIGIPFGPVSGSGLITNNGSGTVTFSGVQPFAGGVTVDAGALSLVGPNANPSTFSGVTNLIINGGSVVCQGDNVMGSTHAFPITINTGGALTGNGTSGHLRGLLTLNGGTLTMGGNQVNTSFGTWDLDGGVLVPGTNVTSTISTLSVIPTEGGGTIFNVNRGTTPSGIDLLVSGSLITGSSEASTGIIKTGNGVMVLDNNNSYTNGTIDGTTVQGGTLQLGLPTDTGVLTAAGSGTLAISSNSLLYLDGSKGIIINGAISDDGTGTVLINSGTNIFGGQNSYTGETIVNSARLILTNGSTIASSSSINVSNGAFDISFGGIMSGSGTLALTNSSFILGTNYIGSIGALSASNSTLSFATFPSTQTTPNMSVSGAFTSGGTSNRIILSAVPGFLNYPVTIVLIKYGSFVNVDANNNLTNLGLTFPALGSPTGYLTNDSANGSIDLVLQSDGNYPILPVTWTGRANGVNAANWDILSTSNWVLSSDGVTPVFFTNGDAVTFDDTAPGTGNVNVTTTVAPASISINNSSKTYTFSGPGKITGATGLSLPNNGIVTLGDSGGDNFTGGITLQNAATLILTNANTAIAGGITMNGGALTDEHSGTISGGMTVNSGSVLLDQPGTITGGATFNSVVQVGNNDTNGSLPIGAGITNNTAIVFDRVDTNGTVTAPISGGGAVTNNNVGTITWFSTNTFTGPVVLNAGIFIMASGNQTSSGFHGSTGLTINNGAQVQVAVDNSLSGRGSINILPVFVNPGGILTGAPGADNSNGISCHLQGLLTLNGGTLANSGTSSNFANGSWDLDDGLATGGTNITSIISALCVVPSQNTGGGTTFNVIAGNPPSGVDLDVTGTIIHATAQPDFGIEKTGNGVLRFSNTNTFNGVTNSGIAISINGGTVIANAPETPGVSGPLGAATGTNTAFIAFGGGTLQYSSVNVFDYSSRFVQDQPYSINTAGQNVTFATGFIFGSSVTKLGAGTLALTSTTNSYQGSTVVGGGTLITTTTATGAGTYTATNGGVLDVQVAASGAQLLMSTLTLGGSATDASTLQIDTGVTASPTVAPVNAQGGITTNGTVNIALSGNALSAGTFPLIAYTGTSPSGALHFIPPFGFAGTLSDNNAGLISVTLTVSIVNPSTNANITHVSLSGTNLLIHGTNNNVPNTNFHYLVLTTTNVATPLSKWEPVVTNSFNADGTFDYTNPIVPGTPRQFIDVKAVP